MFKYVLVPATTQRYIPNSVSRTWEDRYINPCPTTTSPTTAAATTTTTTSMTLTTPLPNTTTRTSLDVTTVETTTSKPKVCYCNCDVLNITTEELLAEVARLKELLKVNKETLTSFKMKKISAPDKRPSAKGIGLVLGAGIITAVLSAIILPDVYQFVKLAADKIMEFVRIRM